MDKMRSVLASTIVVVLTVVTPVTGAAGKSGVAPSATAALDYAETTHLVFMREEEKLARDIYLTFAQWYPNQPVFKEIANSEQRHTDTMRDKLAQYGIADPNPQTNNLPSSIGVFTGADYGSFLTSGFKELTTKGAQGELAALYVGALIEELDMHDIVKCPTVIVEAGKGIGEDGCGLDYTDERALINAYTSLVDGSKNHLRAFVSRIEAVIGEGKYQAQYLSQEEVNAILGR
jgi:hypothetical protein